jgi:two-component system phosphate regulon response regulator PhoB
VVDDDSDVRFILRMILETRGLKIVEAARGETALELAREHNPQLVILDWAMPTLSGIEVARRLLDPPAGSAPPIIMLTGRSTEEDRQRGLEAGVFACLVKPFNPLELLEVVDSALGEGSL